MLKADEKIAIMAYEGNLLTGKHKLTNMVFSGPPEERCRLALAVIRHVIEAILTWTPDEAAERLTLQTIADLRLTEVWNNLPEEVRQTGSTRQLIHLLYPTQEVKDQAICHPLLAKQALY